MGIGKCKVHFKTIITFTHLFKQHFQMNIQQIKAGMTKGTWHSDEIGDITTTQSDLSGDIVCLQPITGGYEDSQEFWEANAAAICIAVNNTWGVGIDPTKIPSLLDRIEFELMDAASLPEWVRETLTEILNSAKI